MGAQGSDGAGATHGQIPTQPEVRQLRQLRQGIGWNLKNGFLAKWGGALAQLAHIGAVGAVPNSPLFGINIMFTRSIHQWMR